MNNLLFIIFRGVSLFLRNLRNGILSAFALFAIFLVLHIFFATGYFAERVINSAVKFDTIRVYPVKTDVNSIASLTNILKTLKGVADIKYLDQESVKKFVVENGMASSGINDLSKDFFPVFFEVKVDAENQTAESIKTIAEIIKKETLVKTVAYGEQWVKKLNAAKSAFFSLIWIITILFTVSAAIIIFNSITLNLYQLQKEVYTYKLVGGTDFFIMAPFISSGILVAIFCAFTSIAFFYIADHLFFSSLDLGSSLRFGLPDYYLIKFLIFVSVIAFISGRLSYSRFIKKRTTIYED